MSIRGEKSNLQAGHLDIGQTLHSVIRLFSTETGISLAGPLELCKRQNSTTGMYCNTPGM